MPAPKLSDHQKASGRRRDSMFSVNIVFSLWHNRSGVSPLKTLSALVQKQTGAVIISRCRSGHDVICPATRNDQIVVVVWFCPFEINLSLLLLTCFSTYLFLAGKSGRLTRVKHSSRRSSATHSCPSVLYFRVSRQWYSCQVLGFVTSAQMLMHAIQHGGLCGTDAVRESAPEVDSGRKIPCRNGGLQQASALHLAFQSDVLATWLFPPLSGVRCFEADHCGD